MEKIWFIEINGNKEGPFSISDLKIDKRINPDTLVWKDTFSDWVPIRTVPELKILFEDESEQKIITPVFEDIPPQKELVIDYREDPPFPFLWLILAAMVISYIIYMFYPR